MSVYTVKQMARLSGVSVRALHHYDAIGLLRPRAVGANGYRYYDREDLLRLQQILFHRALETPLKDIQAALDDPGFDLAAALRAHRVRLASEAERYARLVDIVDRTLADLKGDETMEDKEMFKGFDPAKQARHEAELVERYGEPMAERIAQSTAGMKSWGKGDWAGFQQEAAAIEHDMARALSQGLPVDSDPVTAIMRRHWAWIAKSWNREPTPDAFAGLAHLYQDNPEFTARYEAIAPGLTEYLAEAMRAFAERRAA
ncbi:MULTISPECIES: MerR family transcriptional regulator [Caulobacter]|uniref:Putative transcriptional regulator n=1 Tax=Caulobacter vibrioides OR37 TaxID=1292034 RepID=R0EHR4_CAUVI|nr:MULTISPECIES: MerR family transcriptional regulator [Caulobacter]ENZ80732.1 putative transcriptional regulator [Caulobacter vibrioides OR37]MBQ1563376.1 MerR family transcriptional regulator [Caulobacter sp.]